MTFSKLPRNSYLMTKSGLIYRKNGKGTALFGADAHNYIFQPKEEVRRIQFNKKCPNKVHSGLNKKCACGALAIIKMA